MPADRFSNARIHEWIVENVEDVCRDMDASRLAVNSAAMWWFVTKLSAEERAEILGEYTKAYSLRHRQAEAPPDAEPAKGRPRRGKK